MISSLEYCPTIFYGKYFTNILLGAERKTNLRKKPFQHRGQYLRITLIHSLVQAIEKTIIIRTKFEKMGQEYCDHWIANIYRLFKTLKTCSGDYDRITFQGRGILPLW